MRLSYGGGIAAMLLAIACPTIAMADPVPLEVTDDSGQTLSGDPTKGEAIFHRCMVCHSIKAGENKIGPSLHGVIGRTAGTVEGFNYSDANKKSGIVWTQQKIFIYLKNPQATVPGTKMSFPGLPKPEDRADVIAYLTEAGK
jgi:cytochrome c